MFLTPLRLLIICVVGFATTGWQRWTFPSLLYAQISQSGQRELASGASSRIEGTSSFTDRLSQAALDRAGELVRYDDSYQKIGFPMGDVPENTGNAADEIIRVYRGVGIDLQELVYLDMVKSFGAYPHKKGQREPDTNMDHRQVPILRVFFKRMNGALPTTRDTSDYLPGDIITCALPDGRPHIALVVPAPGGGAPWIVHNMGYGPRLEDRLMEFTITGHYRYHPGE